MLSLLKDHKMLIIYPNNILYYHHMHLTSTKYLSQKLLPSVKYVVETLLAVWNIFSLCTLNFPCSETLLKFLKMGVNFPSILGEFTIDLKQVQLRVVTQEFSWNFYLNLQQTFYWCQRNFKVNAFQFQRETWCLLQ